MERCKLCQPIDSECNGCVFYKIDKLQSENSELKNELQDEIFKHAKLQFAYDMLSDKFLRLEEQIEKMKVEIERRKHCYDCADDCGVQDRARRQWRVAGRGCIGAFKLRGRWARQDKTAMRRACKRSIEIKG